MIHYSKAIAGTFQIKLVQFVDADVSSIEIEHEEASIRIERAKDGTFELVRPSRARGNGPRISSLLGAVRTLVAWKRIDLVGLVEEEMALRQASSGANGKHTAAPVNGSGHANGNGNGNGAGHGAGVDAPAAGELTGAQLPAKAEGEAVGAVGTDSGSFLAAAHATEAKPSQLQAAIALIPELRNPTLRLTLTFREGTRAALTIIFGQEDARFPVIPCHVEGESAIYLVSRYAPLDLQALPEDLRQDRLLDIDLEDVRQIVIRRDQNELRLRRLPTGKWSGDAATATGRGQLAPLIERILALQPQRTIDDETGASASDFGKPALHFEVTDNDGKKTALSFALKKDGKQSSALARVGEGRQLFDVPPGDLEALANALDQRFQGDAAGQGGPGGPGGAGEQGGKLDQGPGTMPGDGKSDPVQDEAQDRVPASPDVARVKVSYDLDFEAIRKEMSCSSATLRQIQTTLAAGRNIMLYGSPGVGKTKLLTLLCGQLCGTYKDKEAKVRANYTIATANAEWSGFDVIGGLQPVVDREAKAITYKFKLGCVSEGARRCARTLIHYGKPHYVVIDEFNRANVDETFGRLFTVFEYRKEQPLLTASEIGEPFYIPSAFRLIGAMNVDDKNSLFNLGYALMRRFSFVEVALPDKEDEYRRLPYFTQQRLVNLGHVGADELERTRVEFDSAPSDKVFPFLGPRGTEVTKCYEMFMRFIEQEQVPNETDRVPRGVRTYKAIGPAQLIDCISAVAVVPATSTFDARRQTLEDQIIANIFPQFEGMDKVAMINIKLKADEIFGETSKIAKVLDRMLKSPSLSVFG